MQCSNSYHNQLSQPICLLELTHVARNREEKYFFLPDRVIIKSDVPVSGDFSPDDQGAGIISCNSNPTHVLASARMFPCQSLVIRKRDRLQSTA